jgi:phosphatidylserine/phosphatidylglycerophosphate/cardiolipin synthase-like enzyme
MITFKQVFVVLAAIFTYQLWNFWQIQPPVRHRFESFAPVRNDSKVKWFVDGQDYMSAVADAIEVAKKEILITDWQMNPYIFMKRPANGVDSLKWRLDKILTRKANEDVLVYILLYWETQLAFDLGSNHTQSILNEHPNIVVYRHPHNLNSIENPSTMLRWSHHEKLVVVDRSIAFVGGIDLCFGRWDTHNHQLMDNYKIHPCAKHDCENKNREADDRYSRWVGKDYKNVFFSNESRTDWERPYDDYEYVSRSQIPRMPWHDVACAFTGAAVSDAVKHFIQRYNALNPSWWKYWELRMLPTELDVVFGNFTSLKSRIALQVARKIAPCNMAFKQIIRFSTRGNNILDLILTNLDNYYQEPEKFSPFGLSHHVPIVIQPCARPAEVPQNYF